MESSLCTLSNQLHNATVHRCLLCQYPAKLIPWLIHRPSKDNRAGKPEINVFKKTQAFLCFCGIKHIPLTPSLSTTTIHHVSPRVRTAHVSEAKTTAPFLHLPIRYNCNRTLPWLNTKTINRSTAPIRSSGSDLTSNLIHSNLRPAIWVTFGFRCEVRLRQFDINPNNIIHTHNSVNIYIIITQSTYI